MPLRTRIRKELDKTPNGDDFYGVMNTIIAEGVSDVELREILPDIIKAVARTRVAAPFMAPRAEFRVPAPLPAREEPSPVAPAILHRPLGGLNAMTQPDALIAPGGGLVCLDKARTRRIQ